MSKPFAIAAVALAFACAHGQPSSDNTAAEPAPKPAPPRNAFAPITFANGQFTVSMPPVTKRNEQRKPIPQGEVVIDTAESLPPGAGETYTATYAGLPVGIVEKSNPKGLLDSVQQSTLQNMGAQQTDSKDIQVEGMPGREFSAKKGTAGNIMGRIVIAKDGIFSLISTYVAQQPPKAVEQFLGSLHATGGAGQPAQNGQPGQGMSGGQPGQGMSGGQGAQPTPPAQEVQPGQPGRAAQPGQTVQSPQPGTSATTPH